MLQPIRTTIVNALPLAGASRLTLPPLHLINLDDSILRLMRDPIGALVRRGFDRVSENTGNLVR